ncbi:SOS response-associated peptidase [Bacillus songklensis]|uniref:Abasic site processing protein n=1 Tax=Bacillus songklensis TaxID=1069116 RepID=A0ABV8B368_9BACI
MCGRFSLIVDLPTLQHTFNFEMNEELSPRYNIAPGQNILTVLSRGEKRAGIPMRWGLVPFWADDPKIGYKMINARAETVDEKASFKMPFQRQRCLILADGFYEWKKEGKEKQPYRFHLRNGKPFAFAGLWSKWTKQGEPLYTCTIITTKPNEVTREVHERMPVILPDDTYNMWLNLEVSDTEFLKSLLLPYPAEEMEVYPVSTLVNSPKNDMAEILSPLNSL